MRGGQFLQGRFNPINKQKYRGDVNNIIYRSSYELAMFRWLDSTDQIVAWASEELIIPYISPVDGKKHRYFTDVVAWIKQHDNSVKKFVIEIKPYDQTQKPKKGSKEKEEAFKNRVFEYAVNQAKWAAAREHCRSTGGEFIVLTEREIFPQQHSLKRYKQPKQPKKK